jgi:hypothetical protein
MAAKAGGIGKDDVTPGEAVMGNVGVGHHEILFANFGYTTAKLSPPVNCHKLSNCGSPANLYNCFLSLEFQSLRNSTYGSMVT